MIIVLEGPDGAGKTSQAALLVNYFTAQGKKAVSTGPHYTPFGQRIHELCKRSDISDNERVLLYTASYTHLLAGIHAAKDVDVSIIDRLFPSAMVYNAETSDEVQSAVEQVWSDLFSPAFSYPHIVFLGGQSYKEHETDDFYEARFSQEQLFDAYSFALRRSHYLARRGGFFAHSVDNRGTPYEVRDRILASVGIAGPYEDRLQELTRLGQEQGY